MRTRNLGLAAVITLFFLAIPPILFAQDKPKGIVKERMDTMLSMDKLMTRIEQRIKRKRDLKAIGADAHAVQAHAARLTTLFPPGSNEHPSAAKSAVWQNWSDFESKVRALEKESGKLAIADLRDLKALAAQFRTTAAACDACHSTYREEHGMHHQH